MSMRSHAVIAISLILMLALSACGQDTSEPDRAPTVPQSVTTKAPGPTEAPTPTEAAALANGADGAFPRANQVSQVSNQEVLYAVKVVKVLTPSVVQILTEFLSMGDFNQSGPGPGVGTGVILDEQGHILTNNHVIAGAQRITVTLSNGDSFPAEVVGGDAETDTAVIRIEADGLQPAKLGRSSELQVGEDVIAIGHALGLSGGPTVSKGVVSALDRSIASGLRITMLGLIQTDAAINPGNSGGPLMNARAEVIGINTAVIEGSQGIGFAINIDDAKFVVAQLMGRGYVERASLGISPFNLNPGLANLLGVPVTEGIAVAQVFPSGAADMAGLQAEDVIVQLGDEPIRNTGELSKFLIAHPAGETVTVVFFRGTEERTAQLTLGEPPER